MTADCPPANRDERILILIPVARDAELARAALGDAGLRAQVCEGVESLGREVTRGAGAALIAQESLTPPVVNRLAQILEQQPPWSDLPLVILTSGASAKEGKPADPAFERLGNATFLERPLRQATLVRAVQVALRTRRRQYEIRQLLQERERAAAEIAALLRQQGAFLRDVLASVTAGKLRLCESTADLPVPLPEAAKPLALSSATLRVLRQRIQKVARAQDFDSDRMNDLITAAHEAAMNAVVHAGGGEARFGASPTGTVQVWIEDRGAGIDIRSIPRATLERGYSSAGTLGHGFWLMLATADRVFLCTGAQGTTVVLEQARTPSEPSWLRGI